MAIYYIDLVNGNDSNSGADWANAWLTVTSGATAARIAPGDTIRISKTGSPSSIGNGTWTDMSATMTLASAQTLLVDNCETAWTSANGSTTSRGTALGSYSHKQGSYAISVRVDSTPGTNEKQAYYTLSSTDYSSYTALTFWMSNSAAILANQWKLCLCSDTAGASIVDTFDIPAIPSTNTQVCLTVVKTGGGALGSAIQSVALYTGSSAPTASSYFYLDNINACNSSGLHLNMLVSKSSSDAIGTEPWWPVDYIDGTTVGIAQAIIVGVVNGGYVGTTETVETYIRACFDTALISASNGAANVVNDSGTRGSNILFSGGWNTSSTTQDGETIFNGRSSNGYGMQLASKNYVGVERLSFTRYGYGIYASGGYECAFDIPNLSCSANNQNMFLSCGACTVNIKHVINGNLSMAGGRNTITIDNILSSVNTSNSFTSSGSGLFESSVTVTKLKFARAGFNIIAWNSVFNITSSYVTPYAISISSGSANNIIYGSTTNCGGGVGVSQGGPNTLVNFSIAESGEVYMSTARTGYTVRSLNHDGTIGNHWIFHFGGSVNWQTSTKHDTEPGSWKITLVSTGDEISKLVLPIAEIAVSADTLVTFKAWVKKDHATNVAAKLITYSKFNSGLVASDASATKANDTNWEELTITFTPTEDGVVPIFLEAWYVSGGSYVYVGSVTATQA